MPIVPQELLALARHLVDRNPGAQVEGDLRRAVSTAYYAVFHLLINEAVSRMISDVSFRPRIGRAFQHGQMKQICLQYMPQKTNDVGEYVTKDRIVLALEIKQIAETFHDLHEAREIADYDCGTTVSHLDAEAHVQRAESAFHAWLTGQAHPSATSFLQDLFAKCAVKR